MILWAKPRDGQISNAYRIFRTEEEKQDGQDDQLYQTIDLCASWAVDDRVGYQALKILEKDSKRTVLAEVSGQDHCPLRLSVSYSRCNRRLIPLYQLAWTLRSACQPARAALARLVSPSGVVLITLPTVFLPFGPPFPVLPFPYWGLDLLLRISPAHGLFALPSSFRLSFATFGGDHLSKCITRATLV